MQADVPIEKLDPHRFMTGAYLYNDVKAYSAMGEHRTDTEVDRKTSEWLRRELEGFGLGSKLHPFNVAQFFLGRAVVTINGEHPIPCVPLWPPRAGSTREGVAIVRVPTAGALN